MPRKNDEDTRTPEQLLDLLEARGREVAEAPAVLRGSILPVLSLHKKQGFPCHELHEFHEGRRVN